MALCPSQLLSDISILGCAQQVQLLTTGPRTSCMHVETICEASHSWTGMKSAYGIGHLYKSVWKSSATYKIF